MTRARSERQRRSRAPKAAGEILAAITDEEAASVLREVLARHPELVDEAVAIAHAGLAAVDRDSVAESVRDAVLAVTVEDIWDRSGDQRDGYIEEVEAAWQVFEAAVGPFQDEVIRLLSFGHREAAQATVEGIVVGLFGLPSAQSSEALSRAEDFPEAAAASTVDRSLAAGGGPLEPAFLSERVPRWAGFLRARKAR